MSLVGDTRDTFLSGAVNNWSVGWIGGRLDFQNDAAMAADAATADTRGGFSSKHASFARLQSVSPTDALYLAVSGQWAPVNLDSSQKMSVGGPYSVRAYDTGAISADGGILATAEMRHDIASGNGRWQVIAFMDSATLRINASPWVAGRNRTTLSGAGTGVDWAGPNQWQLTAYIAAAVGAKPELLGGTPSTRTWVEVRKSF